MPFRKGLVNLDITFSRIANIVAAAINGPILLCKVAVPSSQCL